MVEKPNEDTEPRVQQLFVGSYLETDMGRKTSWRGVQCFRASYYQLAIFYEKN
jgi:hypothetical protein